MGETDWILAAGAVLFVAGTALVLMALTPGGGSLLGVGVVGLVGGAVCLAIASWRIRRATDPRRIEAEQRLWSSGPLGRAWLRIRSALFGRR